MFTAISHRLAGLRARYAEPHRAYHTQAHIDAMLTGLQDLGSAVVHRDAVALAIWYHDAIYNPAAADNEVRSAALLRAEMAGLADAALLGRSERLVLCTLDHRIPSGLASDLHQDAALFLDLDMAVLGAGSLVFDAYEHGIAAEYGPVYGHTRFAAGRAGFLHEMLNRPRLFHSDRFHKRYDEAARGNMQPRAADFFAAQPG